MGIYLGSDAVSLYTGGTTSKSEQEKIITAGTSQIEVTPDDGYVLSKVIIQPTPSTSKYAYPSFEKQVITPPTGKLLNEVIVASRWAEPYLWKAREDTNEETGLINVIFTDDNKMTINITNGQNYWSNNGLNGLITASDLVSVCYSRGALFCDVWINDWTNVQYYPEITFTSETSMNIELFKIDSDGNETSSIYQSNYTLQSTLIDINSDLYEYILIIDSPPSELLDVTNYNYNWDYNTPGTPIHYRRFAGYVTSENENEFPDGEGDSRYDYYERVNLNA